MPPNYYRDGQRVNIREYPPAIRELHELHRHHVATGYTTGYAVQPATYQEWYRTSVQPPEDDQLEIANRIVDEMLKLNIVHLYSDIDRGELVTEIAKLL